MKRFILSVVSLCVIYFVVGFVAVQLGWMTQELFNSYATVVGGLASIFGLLAFALPRLTTSDLRSVEVDALRDISNTINDLQKRERELTAKEEELTKLDLQKAEMEALIRKASLSLFLRDQIDRHQTRVVSIIEGNDELKKLILEFQPLTDRLQKLEEEISLDDNVTLLNEVLEKERLRDRYAALDKWEKTLLLALNTSLKSVQSVRLLFPGL